MSNYPSDWKFLKVSDCLEEFVNGYAFNANKYSEERKYPILRMSNIGLGGKFQYSPENSRYCPPEEYESLSKFHVKYGDVIMAMTDVTPGKELIGASTIVNIDRNFVLNQRVGLLRFKKDIIENKFFAYWTNGDAFKKYAKDNSGASAQANLGTSDIKSAPIVLPTLSEQKKIAEILTLVDRVIELTEIEIEKLKNLKKGMMQDLLTNGIGHTKFKDSPIGKIPESWEVLTIKDVVEFVTYGFTNPMPTTEIGPFMVTATNVNDGRITYENCRRTSQEDYDTKLSNKSKPIINDILLTKDGTLGRVAIVDREGICINQSVALLRTKDSESSLFLKYLLESPYYQDVMINNAGGSTIKHIYITTLDKMHIVWPGVKERVQISNAIDSINKRIKITEQKLTNLTSLKKGLMQDLLTGKVRVKV